MKAGLQLTLMLLLLIACMSLVLATDQGYTLSTSVSLDFTPSRTFAINSMATAVVTITGSIETGGDGKVTITGRGGPAGASIPTASTNLTSTGASNISIKMPDEPGTYYYMATINVHTSSDSYNHAGHIDISSSEVMVTVYDAQIAVRPKKSDGSGDYADVADICAGGKNSNAHIAEIKVTVDPPVAGVTVTVVMSGGAGQYVAALLTMDAATTDADGIVTGTLRSSDRVEDAALSAGKNSVLVDFDWDVDWTWESEYDHIESTNDQTLTFFHHGEPVIGHDIVFCVDEIGNVPKA